MSLNWLSLARLSITTRLMLWFLAISLIPCTLSDHRHQLPIRSLAGTIRSEPVDFHLRRQKRSSSTTSYGSTAGDVEFLSQVPHTIQATDEISRGIERGLIREADRLRKEQEYRPTAMGFLQAYGYANLYLFDAQGRLLFRFKSDLDVGDNLLTGPQRGTELAEVFERSKMLLQAEVSDYQVYAGLTEPAVFIADPILKEGAGHRCGGGADRQQGALPRVQRLRRPGRNGRNPGRRAQGR